MSKMIRVNNCGNCDKRHILHCEPLVEKHGDIEITIITDHSKILPNCPLEDEKYDLGPDLEKAIFLMKRLIKSNAREGWEDSEHYNVVLDDANDFLSNFEVISEPEKPPKETGLSPDILCGECHKPRQNKEGIFTTPCPHCGDEIPF